MKLKQVKRQVSSIKEESLELSTVMKTTPRWDQETEPSFLETVNSAVNDES